jgi:hypothetical protein
MSYLKATHCLYKEIELFCSCQNNRKIHINGIKMEVNLVNLPVRFCLDQPLMHQIRTNKA